VEHPVDGDALHVVELLTTASAPSHIAGVALVGTSGEKHKTVNAERNL
jgi:hypothetical protein